MRNLGLGPVVGQTGGQVETIPVSVTDAVGPGVDHVLAEVDAGDGALVLLTADITRANYGTSQVPNLAIGDTVTIPTSGGRWSVGAHVRGITPIILHTKSNFSSSMVSLTGSVHVVPYPKEE